MKTMKYFSVLCCLAAMCLTSCLNDDNDNDTALTKEQVAQCLLAVKGTHQGNMIYAAKNPHDVKDQTDTLAISWTVKTDSTMTIHNFPTKLLFENISESAATAEVKAALTALPDQDLECRIGFYRTSPISFVINPVSPSYTLELKDGKHKYTVAFYTNTSISRADYKVSEKEMEMQIVEAAIFRDDKLTSYLTEGVPFIFIESQKKK